MGLSVSGLSLVGFSPSRVIEAPAAGFHLPLPDYNSQEPPGPGGAAARQGHPGREEHPRQDERGAGRPAVRVQDDRGQRPRHEGAADGPGDGERRGRERGGRRGREPGPGRP